MSDIIAEAVKEYVLARSATGVVSTRSAIGALRRSCPACQQSDAELAELVAAIAIFNGRMVAFDAREREVPPLLTVPS